MCSHAFVAITLREKLMRERGSNMRERCSRYSFILDISSLDVLILHLIVVVHKFCLYWYEVSDFHDQYCCIVGSV